MNEPYTKESYKPQGPFLNGKQAAAYCGYSHDHFRHLISQYNIPRCGPRRNRYSQTDLDTWMTNPNSFKIKALPKQRRLKMLEV